LQGLQVGVGLRQAVGGKLQVWSVMANGLLLSVVLSDPGQTQELRFFSPYPAALLKTSAVSLVS